MKKQINSLIGKLKNYGRQDVCAIKINHNCGPKQPLFKPTNFPSQLLSQTDRLFIRTFCCQCQKSLHRMVSIKSDNKPYCVACFAKQDHSRLKSPQYSVMSHLHYPLMQQFWPAEHELALLEGIQKCGFGNWQEIKQFMRCVGSSSSVDELQEHYDRFYGQKNDFQPNFNKQLIQAKQKDRSLKWCIPREPKQRSKEKITNYTDQLDHMKPSGKQISCYNEQRQEFFSSYNQKLEKYIADLQMKCNDTPEEIEIKLKLIEAYNVGLRDRYEKEDMIVEHKLLNQAYILDRNQRMGMDTYLTHAQFISKPLMRYMKHIQYEQLLNSVAFCLKIQTMIKALKKIKNDSKATTLDMLISSLKTQPTRQGLGEKDIYLEGQMPRKRVNITQEQVGPSEQKQKFDEWIMKEEDIQETLGLTSSELQQIISNMEVECQQKIQQGMEDYVGQDVKILKQKGITIQKLNH